MKGRWNRGIRCKYLANAHQYILNKALVWYNIIYDANRYYLIKGLRRISKAPKNKDLRLRLKK